MYIVHFMKYEDDILVDAWTSTDYFKTEFDAKRWLLMPDGTDEKFVQDDMFENHYKNEKDGIRLEAEIKYVYEFLGI